MFLSDNVLYMFPVLPRVEYFDVRAVKCFDAIFTSSSSASGTHVRPLASHGVRCMLCTLFVVFFYLGISCDRSKLTLMPDTAVQPVGWETIRKTLVY